MNHLLPERVAYHLLVKGYSVGSRDVMGARLDWTRVCDVRLGGLTSPGGGNIQSSCSSVSVPGCSLLGAIPQTRGSARKLPEALRQAQSRRSVLALHALKVQTGRSAYLAVPL